MTKRHIDNSELIYAEDAARKELDRRQFLLWRQLKPYVKIYGFVRSQVTSLQQLIITMRFGLGPSQPHNLAEVSRKLKIPYMKAYREYKKGMKKYRKWITKE